MNISKMLFDHVFVSRECVAKKRENNKITGQTDVTRDSQRCLTPGKTKDNLSDNRSQNSDKLTSTAACGCEECVCCVSALTASVSICA